MRNFEELKEKLEKGGFVVCVAENTALNYDLIKNFLTKVYSKPAKDYTFAELYKTYLEDKKEFLKVLSVNDLIVIYDISGIDDKQFWKLLEITINDRIIKHKPTLLGTNMEIDFTYSENWEERMDTSLIKEKAEILPVMDSENSNLEKELDDILSFIEEEQRNEVEK